MVQVHHHKWTQDVPHNLSRGISGRAPCSWGLDPRRRCCTEVATKHPFWIQLRRWCGSRRWGTHFWTRICDRSWTASECSTCRNTYPLPCSTRALLWKASRGQCLGSHSILVDSASPWEHLAFASSACFSTFWRLKLKEIASIFPFPCQCYLVWRLSMVFLLFSF